MMIDQCQIKTPALLLQSTATQNSHSTRTQHSHRRQDPLEMMAVHKFIATEVFDDNPDLLEEYSNLVDPHNKSAVVSVAILRKIARLKKIRRGVT